MIRFNRRHTATEKAQAKQHRLVIDTVIYGEALTPAAYNARYGEIRFPKSLRKKFHHIGAGIGILKRMQEGRRYVTAGCLLSKYQQVSPDDYTLVDTIVRKENPRLRDRAYKVTKSGFELCTDRTLINRYCLNKGGVKGRTNKALIGCTKPVLWITLHKKEFTILGFYRVVPDSLFTYSKESPLPGYVRLIRL